MRNFLLFLIPSLCISQTTITNNLFFDGIDREYIVYIPEIYDDTKNTPVVFNFHGGSGYADGFMNTNDMRPIADSANFIAVYPQGAVDYDGGGATSWIHKAPTDHDDIFFVE